MYCDHQSTDVALAIHVGLDVYVAFVMNVFITLLTLAKNSQVFLGFSLSACSTVVVLRLKPTSKGQGSRGARYVLRSLSACYELTEQDGQGTYSISTHIMT